MANTSTPTKNSTLELSLAGIPKEFRERLIKSYLALKRDLAESRHDAAGLNAGKLCETVLRYLQNKFLGQHTAFGKQIPNFAEECRKIVTTPVGSATESENSILPRALVFLYTMRNKRGIGHAHGDVDANGIDSAVMARVADWIVAELIRIHHAMSLEEAQDIVDAIAVRQLPEIWEIACKKRVLREGLQAKDESLLLLYSSKDSVVLVEDLIGWIEYSNAGVFKSSVLTPLHKIRMIEWDRDSDSVTLSPKGADYVEHALLKQ